MPFSDLEINGLIRRLMAPYRPDLTPHEREIFQSLCAIC